MHTHTHSRTRPLAVIVDIDGTLCDVTQARPAMFAPGVERIKANRDYNAFHTAAVACPTFQQAIDFVERHHDKGHKILVVTARLAEHFDVTKQWLDAHVPCDYEGPFMRHDAIADSATVKREIFDYLSRHYEIVGAIDDKPSILALWEELGIDDVEAMQELRPH